MCARTGSRGFKGAARHRAAVPPSRGAALVLALLLLAWLAPLALAQSGEGQAPCAPPRLAFPRAPRVVDPGGSFNLPFAVENPNGPHVEIARADIKVTTPDGWTAIPQRRELTMAPESVQHNVLAVTAPTRGTGAASGNVTISVSFVCTSGVVQQSSTPVQHVVEVRIRAFEAPWLVVIGAFGIFALGVAILGVRRLRRSVVLAPVQAERPIEPGKSAKYTFIVHNRRGKPARYHLVVGDLPEGWTIHLALDDVELEPGEEKTLWAILRAPATAPEGVDVPFTLRLQGERGPRDGATATLRARVQPAA